MHPHLSGPQTDSPFTSRSMIPAACRPFKAFPSSRATTTMYFSASRSFVARILHTNVSKYRNQCTATAYQSLYTSTGTVLANQPKLAMNRQSFNHLVEVLCPAVLGLSQDTDLAIEVFDLFIFL